MADWKELLLDTLKLTDEVKPLNHDLENSVTVLSLLINEWSALKPWLKLPNAQGYQRTSNHLSASICSLFP